MRYILISGGTLRNKGAQAMVFIAVEELRKRFPNHKILALMDPDSVDMGKELDLKFEIVPDIFRHTFAKGIYGRQKGISQQTIIQSTEILKNSDLLVDVSGYALGSSWSIQGQMLYLSRIKTAHRYGLNIYLMPQSFGPFNYKGVNQFMNSLLRKNLRMCDRIFARETEGYNLLTKKYGLNNVFLAADLVLSSQSEYSNVYCTIPPLEEIPIKENSVGIIPNTKTFEFGDRSRILELYRDVIYKLLSQGTFIYVLRHSSEDLAICKEIKAMFEDEPNVVLLEQDFSARDYCELVKSMAFIVASRYHSLVHAYKEGIPCLALGWAIKYQELLRLFDQEQYVFDVCKDFNPTQFMKKLDEMIENHGIEAQKIQKILPVIQANNPFDTIQFP